MDKSLFEIWKQKIKHSINIALGITIVVLLIGLVLVFIKAIIGVLL